MSGWILLSSMTATPCSSESQIYLIVTATVVELCAVVIVTGRDGSYHDAESDEHFDCIELARLTNLSLIAFAKMSEWIAQLAGPV
jgi:hypothetical protein